MQKVAQEALNFSAGDWSPECAAKLKALWADPVIKEVFDMRDKFFQLNDSMA